MQTKGTDVPFARTGLRNWPRQLSDLDICFNVGFQQRYWHVSMEELRWQDYQRQRNPPRPVQPPLPSAGSTAINFPSPFAQAQQIRRIQDEVVTLQAEIHRLRQEASRARRLDHKALALIKNLFARRQAMVIGQGSNDPRDGSTQGEGAQSFRLSCQGDTTLSSDLQQNGFDPFDLSDVCDWMFRSVSFAERSLASGCAMSETSTSDNLPESRLRCSQPTALFLLTPADGKCSMAAFDNLLMVNSARSSARLASTYKRQSHPFQANRHPGPFRSSRRS
jgi:hypothetical protein